MQASSGCRGAALARCRRIDTAELMQVTTPNSILILLTARWPWFLAKRPLQLQPGSTLLAAYWAGWQLWCRLRTIQNVLLLFKALLHG
jgi:hypothetical protein